jgi:hypothetical protein
MADKPKPSHTGQTVKFGNVTLPITDPRNIQAVSAEVIIEARTLSGVVAVGFATINVTGDAPTNPEAVVCARLRLSTASAFDLRNALNNILGDVPPPPPQIIH